VGLQPKISVLERAKTVNAFDSAATVIGKFAITLANIPESQRNGVIGRHSSVIRIWNARNDPNLLPEASFLDFVITCMK
jgi:hypothetical protein